ncbi:MAG: hypothetical protein ACREA8_10615 [Nitrosotalea sp.]
MAESSFAIFGLTIIVVWASSLYVLTVRSIRKRRESTNIVLHTARNLIIGVIVGILLSTAASLDPIFLVLGMKSPWIIIPIVILSIGFMISLVAIELAIFKISFQIKKFPVNENMKGFFDGMLIPIAFLFLLDLFLRIDPFTFKNCCV